MIANKILKADQVLFAIFWWRHFLQLSSNTPVQKKVVGQDQYLFRRSGCVGCIIHVHGIIKFIEEDLSDMIGVPFRIDPVIFEL